MAMLAPDAVIDLHAHSSCSDGTEVPSEVVRQAHRAGLDVVALTDHDVVSGWREADATGAELGVVVVPGIEVSCSWQGISVHLLAYLPDPENPELMAELAASRESRDTRLQRMIGLLADDGYPITYADVLAVAGDGASLGRPHIADVLVRRGVYANRDEAFAGVLSSRSPYYVTHRAPHPVLATELVVGAGGVPVIAHPFASSRGRVISDDVVEKMAEAGLRGIEVDHRDHGAREREHAAALATRLGLFQTGSSDYHGAGKPNLLAENTTRPDVLEAILETATGTQVLGAR